jgi:folate-binding protein YgfZ
MTQHYLNRAVITLFGEDRFSFLQGLITQDVQKAQKGLIYGLMLTPNGRFFTDLFIVEHKDCLLVDVAKEHTDLMVTKFKLYKLRSKVSFSVNEDMHVFVSPTPTNHPLCFMDPRKEGLGYRIYTTDNMVPDAFDPIEYHKFLMKQSIPNGPNDMEVEKSIPLEWSMERLNAIDWTKGCYLGQELTARTHHQGLVRKKVFCLEGNNMERGQKVFKEGTEIGRIVSTVDSLALALLKIEFINLEGDTLQLETNTPVKCLPWRL